MPIIERLRDIENIIRKMEESKLFVNRVNWTPDTFDLSANARFALNLNKLLERKDSILDDEFEEFEFTSLIIESRIAEFCMRLESVKYYLTLILEPSKMRYSKEVEENKSIHLLDMTLGNVVGRINYKIYPTTGLSGKYLQTQNENRKKVGEVFYVQPRNDMIHRRFTILGDGIELGESRQAIDRRSFGLMYHNLEMLEMSLSDKANQIGINV